MIINTEKKNTEVETTNTRKKKDSTKESHVTESKDSHDNVETEPIKKGRRKSPNKNNYAKESHATESKDSRDNVEKEPIKKGRRKSPNKDNYTSESKVNPETTETETIKAKRKKESNKDGPPELKFFKPTFKLENGHSEVIMDIIPMSKVQMLATCSLDKSIILWHATEHKKLRVYREHEKGVVSLAFNESLILLVSAGYDHQICIWNPYIGKFLNTTKY